MIRLQGLHKFFNKGRQNEIHVINDVTLDLPDKGMVAIFGKSGCGKTTLLNVIGGLDGFAQGSVTVEGEDITRDTDTLRNRYIGYIFQNYNLSKGESCFDNVADALRLCGMKDGEELRTRVHAALRNVGMENYSQRTPDNLSGGQQQRIAIARAIVKNPRIILADEPTGNLDEANTVLVMDLLKAIAKDHLVLLVTHEEKLVDHYCDTVIELSDGKVLSVRNNEGADGYTVKDKNDIYLGELPKTLITDERAEIAYYGDAHDAPIRMKVIHHAGKLYVRIESAGVRVLDDTAEIRLKEGVYEEKRSDDSARDGVDMSKLPPVAGERFGSLFNFRFSLKSGFNANFKNSKRGKKVLRRCLVLFSSVLVFMSALFGTAIGSLLDAKDSYNHNLFYVYTKNADISARLNAAVGKSDTGVDHLYLLANSNPLNQNWIFFRMASFETFADYNYLGNFGANVAFLDIAMTEKLPLLAGDRKTLAPEDILITSRVAEDLIEKTNLGYINSAADLVGLISTNIAVDGKYLRIAGVLESDEPAIYLSGTTLAKYVRANLSKTSLASNFGLSLAVGETVLAIRDYNENITYPKVGDIVKLQGREVVIKEIKRRSSDYTEWLTVNDVQKMDEIAFFEALVRKEQPSLTVGGAAYGDAVTAAQKTRHFEYFDYYYAEMDDFLRENYFFERGNFELWLYFEKGITKAKFLFLPIEYCQAILYKAQNGVYPTRDQIQNSDKYEDPYDGIKDMYDAYRQEFYSYNYYTAIRDHSYLVSDEDYLAFAKQMGETTPTAVTAGASLLSKEDYVLDEDYIVNDGDIAGSFYYTILHSKDPQKTQAWLDGAFPDLTSAPYDVWQPIYTPDDVFAEVIAEIAIEIVTDMISLVVILVLLSVCMYFIMRSSLLNRIKEIGVYRAIGVSKKNLIFRFFVEALVLTSLTVFVGYLVSSAFMALCFGGTSLMSQVFYYPLWYALAVLALLLGISLTFGVLPIAALLRKTPSEILAKYDI